MSNCFRSLSIYVVILSLVLTPMIVGCGSSTGPFTGKISQDNLSVTNKKSSVSIGFSEYDIGEKAEVVIKKVESPNVPDDPGISVNAYDFAFSDENKEFISLIDITIPYDHKKIESGEDPVDYVSAGYYDEGTEEWEPVVFTLDAEEKTVHITTDHLSTYAVFTYSKEYTRKTTVKVCPVPYMNLLFGGEKIYGKVLQDMLDNQGVPTDVTMEQGFDIANEALGISGNTLTLITEGLYVTETLNNLGNLFTVLGVAAAIVQAAYDWKKEDDGLALKSNLTKNIAYLSVSIMGSGVAKLCSVGVFCIDYSLNEFGKEAWAGRDALYQKAYGLYYSQNYSGRKLPRRLYNDVYNAYVKSKDNKEKFDLNAETRRVVHKFAGEFWEDESNLPTYLSEAGITFSGLGGLKEIKDSTEARTTESYYVVLMQTIMQPIFSHMSKKIIFDLQRDYVRKLENVKNELNRRITVNIFETKETVDGDFKYSEHSIRFAQLADEADKKNWTGKLKKDATAKTFFTVIGYLQSGAPDKLEIYEKGADLKIDEPVKVVDFTIDLDAKELNIDLGTKPPTLDELVGTWDSSANKFTLLNLDADWDKIKADILTAADEAVDELLEEYGCEEVPEGAELNSESIDQIETGIEELIGVPQNVIFAIEKLDESIGKMTFVSFPNSEGCDSVVGLTFNFNYKDGKLTINYDSLFAFLRGQNHGEGGPSMELIPLIAGNGGFKAEFAKNADGEKIIKLDGNIDYSIRGDNETLPFDIYINYGVHGEK
jgi:hypothetical protein